MFENDIPMELLRQKNWLARRGKLSKSIYRDDWRRWNEPQFWATGDEVIQRTRGTVYELAYHFDGEHFAIDLDGCRNPETELVEPWARQIVKMFCTYTEISLSGSGLHIIGRGKVRSRLVHFLDQAVQHGDHKPQLEVIFKGPLAITGKVFDGYDRLTECGHVITWLEALLGRWCESGFASAQKQETQYTAPPVDNSRNGQLETIKDFNCRHTVTQILQDVGYSVVGPGRLRRPNKPEGGEYSHSVSVRVGSDGIERATFWSTECSPFIQSHSGQRAHTYCAFTTAALLSYGQPELEAKKSLLRALNRKAGV